MATTRLLMCFSLIHSIWTEYNTPLCNNACLQTKTVYDHDTWGWSSYKIYQWCVRLWNAFLSRAYNCYFVHVWTVRLKMQFQTVIFFDRCFMNSVSQFNGYLEADDFHPPTAASHVSPFRSAKWKCFNQRHDAMCCRLPPLHCGGRPQLWRAPPPHPACGADGRCRVRVSSDPGSHEVSTGPPHSSRLVVSLLESYSYLSHNHFLHLSLICTA